MSSTNFTWSILKYFVPYHPVCKPFYLENPNFLFRVPPALLNCTFKSFNFRMTECNLEFKGSVWNLNKKGTFGEKKGHLWRCVTHKYVKIRPFSEKRGLFCQILQRAASDYRTLISSRLFPVWCEYVHDVLLSNLSIKILTKNETDLEPMYLRNQILLFCIISGTSCVQKNQALAFPGATGL